MSDQPIQESEFKPLDFFPLDSRESSVVRPTIVCLCGSTRFRAAYERANRDETLQNRIVLSVGMFGHEELIDMGGPVKAMLDRLHFEKIKISDEILVLNVGGYVGDSTRREIEFARSIGKRVRFLEPHESQ